MANIIIVHNIDVQDKRRRFSKELSKLVVEVACKEKIHVITLEGGAH